MYIFNEGGEFNVFIIVKGEVIKDSLFRLIVIGKIGLFLFFCYVYYVMVKLLVL